MLVPAQSLWRARHKEDPAAVRDFLEKLLRRGD